MLEINNLNLHIDNKHVLEDINLSIPVTGEIIGIMGPNGAGKSSLLKSLIGEFKATGDKLLLHKPLTSSFKHITYIPQKANIDLDFPISVADVVISGAYKNIGWFKMVDKKSKKRLNQLFDMLELQDLRSRQISQLSGGQLQRVLVARALMNDSELYLLDEPFVGIDFHSEQLIIKLINQLKANNKLILIVHHDLSKASEYFDRIILLNRNIRYFGPSHIAMQPDNLNNAFLNHQTKVTSKHMKTEVVT
ncbi:metal ABC transporter ATP-binding protein [Staphylococcus sp. 18_1_E_LY]|uniref:Metal ABC transporter ATP-binding protein n=1 Tax=Staphylococcus lloydii TaxID=2781774 RepID=A0A7T1AZ58_9STAP|nr:metal ABC transporter ATP-binding protein [Staphylococcus lloydii]MBF7019401.1 metal ABC transporter ATP-binding protein [Staphylococcus lloydii]MBF7027129.1 metal ABC transporter ATP-binding protein [Staphylococcus lloydii]QPM74774.1 metal ABC transporter ATP-binding protein [Staphylococcus lloydii]